MRKITFVVLSLIFYCTLLIAGDDYVVKSKNILNPDLNIEYVRKNAEFWIKYAYDATYGGFYSSIGRDGTITNTNQKSIISQERHGYGFTRAFMLTGDEKYLTYAKSALDFQTKYGWDKTNEGWYYFAKRNGALDNRVGWNPNTSKIIFQQHYGLVGLLANYEATRDATIKTWLDKGITSLYNHMWDSRSGFEGYYETAGVNWSSKTGKGFAGTVDGITTNAELTYLVTKTNESKTRFFKLADIIVSRFIPEMDNPQVFATYPETYSTDWSADYTSSGGIGHFVKTAWCLGRAYLCDTTQTQYKEAAIKILDQTWNYNNNGTTLWDHTNGGPFFQLNASTGEWLTSVNSTTQLIDTTGQNKDYWTMEQGFTGPMINYYITKNPTYLQMADESIDFFMTHQVDSVYGEIFSTLDPTGLILKSQKKGDDFKSSYHSSEMGYYAYLYSNLYYLHQPASLYYKFPAMPSTQAISLSPIPMEEGLLRIKSVTLDGAEFTNFDSKTRTLNIAANQGGKFKVTFESIPKDATALSSTVKETLRVFPTLTKGLVQIDGLNKTNRISVVDLTGIEVYTTFCIGESCVKIDLNKLKSGVYFVVSHKTNGELVTRRIIKQ